MFSLSTMKNLNLFTTDTSFLRFFKQSPAEGILFVSDILHVLQKFKFLQLICLKGLKRDKRSHLKKANIFCSFN